MIADDASQATLDHNAELRAHLETLRPKRLPWLAAMFASAASLLLAFALNTLFQQNADLRNVQACRAQVTADGSVAQGNVILIISRSITATDPDERAALRLALGSANAELIRTQAERLRINDVCK